MSIIELLTNLKVQLNQLAIKNNEDALLDFVNLGLIELYKRFYLSVKSIQVNLPVTNNIYTLPSDCMKIVAVLNEHNNPLPIYTNSYYDDCINIISWNKLKVPSSISGSYITIKYASAPEPVDVNTTELPLPPQLLNALYEFVLFKAFSTVNGSTQRENNAHYMRFEAACKAVEEEGLTFYPDLPEYSAFYTKGFY